MSDGVSLLLKCGACQYWNAGFLVVVLAATIRSGSALFVKDLVGRLISKPITQAAQNYFVVYNAFSTFG